MLLAQIFSLLTGVSSPPPPAPNAPPLNPGVNYEQSAAGTTGMPPGGLGTPASVQEESSYPQGRPTTFTEALSNWRVDTTPLADNAYEITLRAWPLRNGGEGEGHMLLKRKVEKMKRQLGFTNYRISNYNEGIETTFPFAMRYVYAIVEFDGNR